MSSELERRIASLSPERIKALAKQLTNQSQVEEVKTGVPRMPRNEAQRYPLSSAQERMWFLCQLSVNSTAFNNPGVIRARATQPLDRARFEKSVQEVVQRHEILRTTFDAEQGRPFQVIHDRLPAKFDWQDLRASTEQEREQAIATVALAEGLQQFNLTTGPLLAFRIVHLDDLDYLLLITSHHIVSDGWSNGMLAQETSMIYSALEPSDAPPPPRFQYVDYVAWEEHWIKSDRYKSTLEYWKQQLSPDVPLTLPTDYPRPRVMSYAGSLHTDMLSRHITSRLKDFAREERVSLFQLLIAGFMAVLYKYTEQETISVGTQTANRNTREFQNVMGLFANTLVIRGEVDGHSSFRDFLMSVRSTCQDALRHQELPFERLVGELNPHRSLNTHPIFQVMYVHQNIPSLYKVPGLSLEVLKIDYQTSKFDLNLWTEEINDGLSLTLHYSRDLFNESTIKRLLIHYRTLLENAATHPDKDIDALQLSRDEVRQATRDWERKETHTPVVERFHRRFESQVARSPDDTAVEDTRGGMTYRDLNRRANQLARHLVEHGVGPEDRVGLLLPRTAELLVGVLGVLKAGGAYVPLETQHPDRRLETVLADSGARMLVTESRFKSVAERISVEAVRVYLDLDADVIALNREDDIDPASDADALSNRLAYVVYTSGTTGTPKGVAVEHKNLVSYCDAIWEEMRLTAGGRFATLTSPAADLGNTMIFPPLLNGGCVVLVPEDMATDPVELADHFGSHPVDCVKLVPSHAKALLKSDQAGSVLPRRLLILGGEASKGELITLIRSLAPGLRILNHYGPSETTVGVLTYEVPFSNFYGGDAIPIGFPLSGTSARVLDKRGETVPMGVPGELVITGPTVARGYLNRPELTAERFGARRMRSGERCFRTGDRAKRVEDGAFVFLGRTDRQIKLRGFRVELEEIERVLSEHPKVGQAVVLPPAVDDARQRLVAHVQRTDTTLDADELRQYMGNHLPSYMIPGAFGFHDEMPLTENGKLDLRALSTLDVDTTPERTQAPRDTIELALTHIWQDLLDVEGIGIDDGFFELGGHSLLAVQLMAVIRRRFDCHLRLSALFEHGTIRRLAELIRIDGPPVTQSPLVAIQPKGDGRPFFFVHPAGGNVLCYYELARCLGAASPFWGAQSIGSTDNANPVDSSIAELARTYLDAVIDEVDTIPLLGGWSMGALVAFEMARMYAEELGKHPTVLVLDQIAPQQDGDGATPDLGETQPDGDHGDIHRLVTFARKVSELVGHDIGVSATDLVGKTHGQQASLFLNRFKAYELAPETTSLEEFRGFLDLMLSHNRVTAGYSAGVYPGKIIVFRAENAIVSQGTRVTSEPDLGWQLHTEQPVEIVGVPGNHVSMMRAPHVDLLAERIANALRTDGALVEHNS